MNILKIKNGNKAYQKDNFVWKNLNLDLNKGEIVGLIGANGSGKTTLFKSILKVIKLNSGTINTNLDVEKDIGYLLEIDLFNNLTAYENLKILGLYSGIEYSKDQIDNVLNKVGLEGQKNKKVKSFSFGMQQRLRLAAATITHKKLLLLDEPLVGLDPKGIETFLNTIKTISTKYGTTIIIATHQISEVSNLFDRYYYFSNKQLLEAKMQSDYYEIAVEPNSNFKSILNSFNISIHENVITIQNISETVKIISLLHAKNIKINKISSHDSIIKEVF
ncbi:MAG: ABC transporter ATP-binding protein [Lactobacillaceae bacterium]|jgi:ABC-2 type transport system ATP-binding protein|nr:ABC transporter ATP-binding protein [Lactobacillaceae bacterium]